MPRDTLRDSRVARRTVLVSGAATLTAAGLSQVPLFGGRTAEAAPPVQAAPTGMVPGMVAVEVLQNPSPTLAQGNAYLLYELYLTNFEAEPLTITTLSVNVPGSTGPALRQYAGSDLAGIMRRLPASNQGDPAVLTPGGRSVAYLYLKFDQVADVPSSLSHTLTFSAGAGKPIRLVNTSPMHVLDLAPTVISRPVQGSGWAAANALANDTGHRRTILVVDGHPYSAQRYAIDFVQIDETGQTYRGNPALNQSYFCYGKDLIAVGDGKVVHAGDGLRENVPHSGGLAIELSLETVQGNYAVIDIGNGRYACYAHMIPGSVLVKPGGLVRRGDPIGKVGNSGNSSEPHLHIHVTDGPSFVGANGVPYVFDYASVRRSKQIDVPGDPYAVSFEVEPGPPFTSRLNTFLNGDVVDFGS